MSCIERDGGPQMLTRDQQHTVLFRIVPANNDVATAFCRGRSRFFHARQLFAVP